MTFDRRIWGTLAFAAGLACVIAYWVAVKPPDPSWLGYSEDIGNMELARILMADALHDQGGPAFTTTRVMAPDGIAVPYFSWLMERDWFGAYLWNHAPTFPWLWVYLGLSLVASFVGTGWLLTRMKLAPLSAWSLATLFVLFNLPRHYKLYYHYEHALQHWLYLGLFLDAWIANRFWRERRWSLDLELWRGVCLLGMLGTAGYYWGPLIFTWFVLRAGMGWTQFYRRGEAPPLVCEFSWKKAAPALAVAVGLLAIDLRWFLPLSHEMNRFGEIWQARGWFASFRMIFRPLWIEPALRALEFSFPAAADILQSILKYWKLVPLDWPETIVTVGWIYLVPASLGIWLVRRKRGGPGFGLVLPFLLTWLFAALYARQGWPLSYHDTVAALVPFMKYFRTASRMGLIFVPLLGVIIALSWPELSRWAKRSWSGAREFRALALVFAVLSAAELSTLATPIVTIPPLTAGMSTLLANVRAEPGTTVLDMPFCVAGGNGICTREFCAKYPMQTMPIYLTARHGKKVFGIYQGRMNDEHCAKYRQSPYASWVEAWKQDRCLTPAEWDGLCAYLAGTPELSALLVYPGIWTAAGKPECESEFHRRLGEPRARAEIATFYRRGPIPNSDRPESLRHYWPTPVLWYDPKCVGR